MSIDRISGIVIGVVSFIWVSLFLGSRLMYPTTSADLLGKFSLATIALLTLTFIVFKRPNRTLNVTCILLILIAGMTPPLLGKNQSAGEAWEDKLATQTPIKADDGLALCLLVVSDPLKDVLLKKALTEKLLDPNLLVSGEPFYLRYYQPILDLDRISRKGIRRNEFHVLEILIAHGADLEMKDQKGRVIKEYLDLSPKFYE